MNEELEGYKLPEHKKLPNESAVLVLGILSICSCVMWGIPGLILGIVALVLYKKDKPIYDSDPISYERSFKNSNAGKICAIIGVSLSAFAFLFILVYFLIIGTFFLGFTNAVNNAVEYNKHHNYNKPQSSEIDSTLFIENDSTVFEFKNSPNN